MEIDILTIRLADAEKWTAPTAALRPWMAICLTPIPTRRSHTVSFDSQMVGVGSEFLPPICGATRHEALVFMRRAVSECIRALGTDAAITRVTID